MQTIRFKGEKYRVLFDFSDLDDVDVTIQKEVAGTWTTFVRGIYGYGLTLSTHGPGGTVVALPEDLHEELEAYCESEVEAAREEAEDDEDEDDEDEEDS